MICGLAAVGKVFMEALIIAYGGGRNGKSTFWNTSTADFYFALETAGYERIVQNRKRFFKGLALKADDGDFLE